MAKIYKYRDKKWIKVNASRCGQIVTSDEEYAVLLIHNVYLVDELEEIVKELKRLTGVNHEHNTNYR